MADIPTMEGFLQQQLECSVCLQTYNLEARTPTALKCQHTFCKQCVDTLATKQPLTCPKCNRRCEVKNLVKNFALCDVLSELCHSCQSREIEAQNLCATCLAAQDQIFQDDVKQNLNQLRQEVRKSSDLSSDDSVLDNESTRAAAAIEQIQKKIQTYQDEIRKLEARLKNKVTELQGMNIESYTAWQHKLEVEIANCKSFLRKSDVTVASRVSSNVSRDYLVEINTNALEFLSILQGYKKSKPTPIEYTFMESLSAPDVGEITSKPATTSHQPTSAPDIREITSPPSTGNHQLTSAPDVREIISLPATSSQQLTSAPDVGEIISPPVTSRLQPTSPDYTRAKSVAVSGSQGLGSAEFAEEGYVSCIDHSYIVSDTDNHRLKVYDKDLYLMFIFGEEGNQKHQFNCPRGLCVSPSGELYVSDSRNHRIKVYDKYFQLVRTFVSLGSDNDEMSQPMGLAFTQTGQLLVADFHNYHVKVLGADGSYIRTIGSKGQGPGQFADPPISVAVTPDGHVLVNEACAVRLLMFTLSGAYVQAITPSIPNTPNVISIWGFTTDCHGNIIIADQRNHQLIVLDSRGQLTCVVGREGDQPGELRGPMSVAVNTNNVLVYEAGNIGLQLFEI